ncbi:hypothetical protein D6D13_06649 [Aureobasidium pullulans]|uniref:Uncharacterized protein n=1 Tax=Aureobasidium pullulans TaxID=5580 RepID=A0A4S9CJK9_AURPU|nr:hypothetical protein D6D13_06649 [Aureobasidium pullulans]
MKLATFTGVDGAADLVNHIGENHVGHDDEYNPRCDWGSCGWTRKEKRLVDGPRGSPHPRPQANQVRPVRLSHEGAQGANQTQEEARTPCGYRTQELVALTTHHYKMIAADSQVTQRQQRNQYTGSPLRADCISEDFYRYSEKPSDGWKQIMSHQDKNSEF